MLIEHPDYVIRAARYAKNIMAITCPSTGGYITRAGRLAQGLVRFRYTNRERAYIVPGTKAERFVKLYAQGWTASAMTGDLIPPPAALQLYEVRLTDGSSSRARETPHPGPCVTRGVRSWLRADPPLSARTRRMRRYTYKRMSAQELSKALDQVGLSMRQFCRTTGANEGTVEKWLEGIQDVPHWVPVLLSLLTLPSAKAMALRVTEHYLEGENDGTD